MENSRLPSEGFVRLWDFLGSEKRKIKAIIPVSNATWWEMIRKGKAPPPIKLGPNTTVWRVEDIRQYIADGEWRAPEVLR